MPLLDLCRAAWTHDRGGALATALAFAALPVFSLLLWSIK